MDAARPRADRRQRVDDGEPAVAVPVPVEPDRLAALAHHLEREAHQVRGPTRRGVPHGVAQAEPLRAAPDRGQEQLAQRRGMGAHRVLGDVHDRQPVRDREPDGLLGVLEHHLERPVLGVLPDGR